MILLNVPRVILYASFVVLAAFGEAPWWLAPSMFLFDWPASYRVLGWPGATRKAIEASKEHLRLHAGEEAINLPGPKNPKKWS